MRERRGECLLECTIAKDEVGVCIFIMDGAVVMVVKQVKEQVWPDDRDGPGFDQWSRAQPLFIEVNLSFSDFLCDSERCPEQLLIDHSKGIQTLAMACFRLMKDIDHLL